MADNWDVKNRKHFHFTQNTFRLYTVYVVLNTVLTVRAKPPTTVD